MNSDMYWLNVTNITLGIVTAIALVTILRSVVADLLAQRRHQAVPEDKSEL